MALKEIAEKKLPTIMTASEELALIEKISKFTDSELLQDLPSLVSLLDQLYESHTGGAIFEVDDTNRRDFHSFANRLQALAKRPTVHNYSGSLMSIADALMVEFPKPIEKIS